MSDKNFYTTIEAAKLLRVSVRTVQLWVENGALEAWKTAGGHRRIAKGSVDNYIQQSQKTVSENSAKKRVLIVEDNPTVSKFYEAAINSWGQDIEVISKNDGFEGLIEIGRQIPDVLVTDIYMPGMDGLQMIQSLYKSKLLFSDRIIVISGLSTQSIDERGGIPSEVDFFTKPIDIEQFKKALFAKLAISSATS